VLTSSAATGNQWLKGGIAISGATGVSYTATESGSYSVQVSNGAGCSATAVNQTVTVNELPPTPVITAGGPTTFCAGLNVTLTSSAATGNQWFRDGVALTGAVNTTYSAVAAGAYTVKVTNAGNCSATSSATTVTLTTAPSKPVITRNGSDLSSDATAGNQWFAEGVAISGATSQTFRPSASGNYSVRVTQNGCNSLPSDNYYFLITAITDPNAPEHKVLVFPNPVQDKVYITNNTTASVQVQVFDITGKQLTSVNLLPGAHYLPAIKWSKGTYLVVFTDQRTHKTWYKKLVKQ
jgi:hypothetical protein